MALQHLRSSTANKRPVPGNMSDGQLGINTNTGSPGLFFKDSNNTLVKVGPVHVGTTAPNASPASGGTAGNSVGEQWLDTTGGTYVFKVWDGSAWRSESGTFVDVNGDVMTGALGIIAGSAGSPGLYFSGDTNTGIYSPGADQVAISTSSVGRVFVDASGNVGIGAAPSTSLHLMRSASDAVFCIDGGGSSTSFVDFRIAGSNKSYVGLGGLTGGSNNDLINYNSSAGNWITYTNGSERARIDSSGRLLVGLSSGTPSTTVFGTAIASVLTHSRDASSTAVAQFYGNAGEFRIIGSGNAQNTNNSYGAISDQSLKTDIADAGSQWDDIKGITVRKFKLVGTDTLQIGVVAQECELVSPGLVEDTVLEQEDGTTSTVKAVKYSVLYMKAVKALQEAMERIEQLEQRLAAAGI